MAIILPHTTSDIQYFRSNGVCYRRTDWGIEGTPDTSWDEVVDTPENDFGTYASCETCQDAISTPTACPCTYSTFGQVATGAITSCGYPEDPIYRYYNVNFSNFAYCPGYPVPDVSIDQAELTNVLFAGYSGGTPGTFQCIWQYYYYWGGGAPSGSEPIRIPGTTYAIYNSGSPSVCIYQLQLYVGKGWFFYGYIGTNYYIWRKTTGVSPAGVYTVLACGESVNFDGTIVINRALAPSSILIEPVIP